MHRAWHISWRDTGGVCVRWVGPQRCVLLSSWRWSLHTEGSAAGLGASCNTHYYELSLCQGIVKDPPALKLVNNLWINLIFALFLILIFSYITRKMYIYRNTEVVQEITGHLDMLREKNSMKKYLILLTEKQMAVITWR